MVDWVAVNGQSGNHPRGGIATPEVGAVIAGKYEVEALLGRGGMGAVYRAQHLFTHRRVALKWLLADDESMRMRFIREARAMGALEHPNVVGVLDIGEHEGAAFLVMEFLEGETLREHMGHRAFPPDQAIRILMPALEGIAAAHQAGIVHRDLKPANVFVCIDRDGTVYDAKVLDFGLALSSRQSGTDSDLTQSGAVIGTPRYMAPEQIRGERAVSARADQYAMALILYQMLAGRLPYEAQVYEALVVEIATLDPPSPRVYVPTLPQGLAEVILRALRKDPEQRYPDIEAFARALEPFAEGVSFRPPRQAHARRSILEEDIVELANASAALAEGSDAEEGTHAPPRLSRGARLDPPGRASRTTVPEGPALAGALAPTVAPDLPDEDSAAASPPARGARRPWALAALLALLLVAAGVLVWRGRLHPDAVVSPAPVVSAPAVPSPAGAPDRDEGASPPPLPEGAPTPEAEAAAASASDVVESPAEAAPTRRSSRRTRRREAASASMGRDGTATGRAGSYRADEF